MAPISVCSANRFASCTVHTVDSSSQTFIYLRRRSKQTRYMESGFRFQDQFDLACCKLPAVRRSVRVKPTVLHIPTARMLKLLMQRKTPNDRRAIYASCCPMTNQFFFVQLSLVFSKAAAWYPRHLPCFSYLNVVKCCVSLALEGRRKMSSKLDKLLKDVQKMVILNYIAGFLLKRKTVLISKKK